MAVTSFLQGLAGRASGAGKASDGPAVIAPTDTHRRLEMLDDFEQSGIGWLWASDPANRLIYISQAAADRLGRPISALLAKPLAELFESDPDNPDERSDRPLRFQLSAHNKLDDVTLRFVTEGGDSESRRAWWSVSGHPKFDQAGAFQGYRGSAKDITAEYERKLEDSRLAEYDSLTGLANRHRMAKQLDQLLAACRSARRSCAVIMLDLDRFKQVNDTLGHLAGDELLKQVAERLGRIVAGRGEIGRIGGDEFQIVLPDLDDRGKLGEMAERLIQIVSQPYQIDGARAVIGASLGMAIAPYDGLERNDVVRNADLALYAAKNGGRGQYRFFSADLKDEAEERRLIEADLREALAAGQLDLHYQPVVRTADNRIVGFEALMRWQHPERGLILPDLFIPIAEESNLINQLGEWALRRACADATAWPASVRVAVNVSAAQFGNSGFLPIVVNTLAATGIDAGRLELELTESVFMGDSDITDETFRQLKAIGVRLALDDFGTGYSSLSYLRSAPFDKIKVDKSFVDSCTQKDQNSAKIIAAIIGLSEALGMETTVEGVEAFDQFRLVCDKGAKFIQGYIYAKPMPQDEVVARMGEELRLEPAGPERHRSERRTMFRRVGVIHTDHRYDAILRNLSKSGAWIEGLIGVAEGTGLVLDLGAGQLAVCTVSRVEDAMLALEFETPLVSDGAGGLCTRHRISPYALAAAGMPLAALPAGNYPLAQAADAPQSKPQFLQVAVARG